MDKCTKETQTVIGYVRFVLLKERKITMKKDEEINK